MKLVLLHLLVVGLLLAGASATDKKKKADKKKDKSQRKRNKSGRKKSKMVVFGDSTSDTGRRFAAPGSFDFDDIGVFPWEKLFEAPENNKKIKAYLPSKGTATNGPVWPDYLRVPQDLNFATSSATASDDFRSRESCTGYTGEGEKKNTATLGRQIKRYFRDVVDKKDSALASRHTHVILLGGNDIFHAVDAIQRYGIAQSLGLPYQENYAAIEPVKCTHVFGEECCLRGTSCEPNFIPVVEAVVTAISEGVAKLLKRGVRGNIFVANIGSFKAAPGLSATDAAALDAIAVAINTNMAPIFEHPQVRKLDIYSLFEALSDREEVFTDKGFKVGKGVSLNSPCLQYNFAVDGTAEIMQTQELRGEGCQNECALCADLTSPCKICLKGNPSATVCEDDPDTRIFWDNKHPTTEFHRIFAEAIRQCAKKKPDYKNDWVEILCPKEGKAKEKKNQYHRA